MIFIITAMAILAAIFTVLLSGKEYSKALECWHVGVYDRAESRI